jgi:hypothetical protein
MKLQKIIKCLILFGVMMPVLVLASSAKDKPVYGYLEPVTLLPDNIPILAKLDTGAMTASLSAKDIQLYKKNNKKYVKFEVSHPDIQQAPVYDLPVRRFSKIKNRSSESTSKSYDSRPVVRMPISFDGEQHSIMVNLTDRSHFKAPLLLGRKSLEKLNAVVDSTIENTF